MSNLDQTAVVVASSWSLASHGKLCFRTWLDDDISVVYNELSGDTHLVNALGLEVLQLLIVSNLTFEMLTLRLSELCLEEQLDEGSQLKDALDATLFQLQDAGLICETPS